MYSWTKGQNQIHLLWSVVRWLKFLLVYLEGGKKYFLLTPDLHLLVDTAIVLEMGINRNLPEIYHESHTSFLKMLNN